MQDSGEILPSLPAKSVPQDELQDDLDEIWGNRLMARPAKRRKALLSAADESEGHEVHDAKEDETGKDRVVSIQL